MGLSIERQMADIMAEHWICECGEWAENLEEQFAHVAAAVVASLGLTQEWTWSWPHGSARDVPGYGYSVDSREEAESEGGEYNIVSRYVTEWAPS